MVLRLKSITIEEEQSEESIPISVAVTKKEILNRISKSFNIISSSKIKKELKNVVEKSLNESKGRSEIEDVMIQLLKKHKVGSSNRKAICDKVLNAVEELLKQREMGRMKAAIKIM